MKGFSVVWYVLLASVAAGLAGCSQRQQIHEFPSPDGAYLVRTEVRSWPTVFGGRRVTLTVRHIEGEPAELARFGGLQKLEMAWLGVGRLKICAEAKTRDVQERVEVKSPRGRRVFTVVYACPALGAADAADARRPPRPAREGERRFAERGLGP